MSNPFVREEPESIRKWRLEHEEQIRRRDEEEAAKKDELRTQASKELEDWWAFLLLLSKHSQDMVTAKPSDQKKSISLFCGCRT